MKVTEQFHLQAALAEIFPGYEIIQNSRRKSNVISPVSGNYLEFDFWIPKLQLAFEFQDQYHYATTFYSNSSLALIKRTDDLKIKLLQDRGGTVICVPCWWNGNVDILMSTIHAQRNDLFPEFHGNAIISSTPPKDFFKVGQVADIGELTQYSFPVQRFDPTSWWMSEKYDGVRACWHFASKKMCSWRGRYYDDFLTPFVAQLMSVKEFLDGEIWFGRGTYSLSQDFARGAEECPVEWQFLRYIVFDSPTPAHSLEGPLPITTIPVLVLEERYSSVLKSVPIEHSYALVSPNIKVRSKGHLKRSLRDLLQGDGEGLIVREARSTYAHGRSSSALKFKRHAREEEGVVAAISHDGTYSILMPNGATVVAALERDGGGTETDVDIDGGTDSDTPGDVDVASVDVANDSDNESIEFIDTEPFAFPSPRMGDIVTFTWTGASRKQGVILRVRKDLDWPEVTHKQHQQQNEEIAWMASLQSPTRRPMGYWTTEHNRNMRDFMNRIARDKHHFDPLAPEGWYRQNKYFLLAEPGGVTILNHYKGSFKRAVMDLFPEVRLQEHLFEHASRGYWEGGNSTRTFFYAYAERHGFNPNDDRNWYSVTAQTIQKQPGGYSILRKFKGAITQALLSVFPNLDETKFAKVRGGYWQENRNLKAIFDKFADRSGFDPLDPEGWYQMGYASLDKEKKKFSILRTYGSLYNALVAAYPAIGLSKDMKSKDSNAKPLYAVWPQTSSPPASSPPPSLPASSPPPSLPASSPPPSLPASSPPPSLPASSPPPSLPASSPPPSLPASSPPASSSAS